MSALFQRGGMEQNHTHFSVLILCDDEIVDYFATYADTMIDIVCEVDLNKDWFWISIFNRNIILSHLNVKLIFSFCISIYFSIIRIREISEINIIYNIFNSGP